MQKKNTPYKTHVFVCTNDRGGDRESCSDHGSREIRAELKAFTKEKGWKGKVRVSASGCLGLCASGPNVMIYPQGILFSEVTPADIVEIKKELENIVG